MADPVRVLLVPEPSAEAAPAVPGDRDGHRVETRPPAAALARVAADAGGSGRVARPPEGASGGERTGGTAGTDAPDVDCVVVGHDPPAVDAPSLVGAIRRRRPSLPVVVYTAAGDDGVAADALRAGADDYVPARRGVEALTARVRAAVDHPGTAGDPPGVDRAGRAVADGGSAAADGPAGEYGLAGLADPVFAVDADGRVVYCNAAAASLAGAAAEAVVGRPVDEAFPTLSSTPAGDRDGPVTGPAARPADGDDLVESCLRAIDRGEPATALTRAADREAFYEARVHPSDGEAVVVLREVTDRVERERELERYETIVDALADPVYVFDEDGDVVFVNEAFGEQFGASPEEIVAEKDVYEGMDPADLERARERIRELLASEDGNRKATFEMELVTDDGRRVPVENHMALLPHDDEFRGTAGVLRDISERKARETELRRYETVIEAVGDPVYTLDRDGRITYVNEATVEVLGYPEEELVGTSVFEFMPDEDVATGERLIRELLGSSDRRKGTFEMRVITADGERIPVENHLALLPDEEGFGGTAGVLRDISERKAREEDLRQYETIVHALADPVYATDEAGRFTFVNPAFGEMMGHSPETVEAEGVHFSEFTTPEDAERILDAVGEMLSSETDESRATLEITGVTADGRRIPIEDSLALLPYEEEFQGTAGVLRDVSRRKQEQQRLEVMNRVLRHNVRNQMNVIAGGAETIASMAEDPNVRHLASTVLEAADEMARVSDNVRDLEKAVDPEEDASVDLSNLVGEVVDGHRERHPEAELVADLPGPLFVEGEEALGHAVDHLVENAVVHNDKPDPRVEVDLGAVDDRWVELTVADNGPGIPEQDRAVVTGQSETGPLQHGSGLGLWMATWVVRSFGGEIDIEDRDPEGSIVRLRLPRAGE